MICTPLGGSEDHAPTARWRRYLLRGVLAARLYGLAMGRLWTRYGATQLGRPFPGFAPYGLTPTCILARFQRAGGVRRSANPHHCRVFAVRIFFIFLVNKG